MTDLTAHRLALLMRTINPDDIQTACAIDQIQIQFNSDSMIQIQGLRQDQVARRKHFCHWPAQSERVGSNPKLNNKVRMHKY
jgi:hypothetical protein